MKLAIAALCAALSGCVTISATKGLAIHPQPGETTILVNAVATTTCKDMFIVIKCRLNVDVQQVK